MKTEMVIDRLSQEGAGAPGRRLPWASVLLAAFGLCLAALALALGQPFAALPRIGAAPYAMKLAVAAFVAVAGAFALRAAGTPGRPVGRHLAALAIPFAAVLVLAATELAATEPDWPGATWVRCLTAIALLTPVTFAAAVMACRSLAPTRPRLTGALAGLFAAGAAASAYALWCPETNATFLLTWYAGPILVAGAVGALLGPRLLRW